MTTLAAMTSHARVAEVEVDPDTGSVTVLRYAVAQDVGRAINPAAIEGQIEGAVRYGIGLALHEDLPIDRLPTLPYRVLEQLRKRTQDA